MKRCLKLAEPASLADYKKAKPDATWEEMRDDPFDGGQQAARDVKATLVLGQRCLCAFCETRISNGLSAAEIHEKRHQQRVEHFHPKSDANRPPNWDLEWTNLWAVCLGGSNPDKAQQEDVIFPLPENLSCDAYKDHQIRAGKLPMPPEGWVLAPDQIPAFPLLFRFSPEGAPEPHPENCAATTIPGHQYPDTATFVSKTIEHLNLGCARLNRARLILKGHLEKEIQRARQARPGVSPEEVLLMLARRHFSGDATTPWPEHFSLIRWRLDVAAEARLQEVQVAG